MKLTKGTQVVYKPDHIMLLDFDYPNGAQPGFVMSVSKNDGDYFVRYWRIEEGLPRNELRTKANSELTSDSNLVVIDTVPQDWVDQAITAIEAENL